MTGLDSDLLGTDPGYGLEWDLPSAHVPDSVGLVLTGGGARAADQVGVLRAVAALLEPGTPNPFPIICGTSAGAINAAALASGAENFRGTVHRLAGVWREFHAHQVYRADARGVMMTGMRWLSALLVGGRGRHNPASLLDNRPLGGLLAGMLDLPGIQRAIDAGHLHALSVTASGYASGDSVSFCQAAREVRAGGVRAAWGSAARSASIICSPPRRCRSSFRR